jgi:hypothetical protein
MTFLEKLPHKICEISFQENRFKIRDEKSASVANPQPFNVRVWVLAFN